MVAKAGPKKHVDRLKGYEEAKNRDIVSVAESLGMNLAGRGSSLYWDQHDSFKFYRKRNYFYWNSRQKGGGPIELVRLIKGYKLKEAVNFLLDPEYEIKEAAEYKEEPKDFSYFLNDHKNMTLTKDYLINERKLSEETVNFYISNGLLAQTSYKDPIDRKTEPVMVFKSRDKGNKVTGVSLRGLWKQEKHDGKGYLRRVLGDGFTGMVQKVGNPPEGAEISKERPLKIIAFEAPIDLMSYYEMYQHKIGDALLVAMDGFKKGTISKLLANQLNLSISEDDKVNYIDILSEIMKKNSLIQLVLAVDNDRSGKNFIEKFEDVPFSVTSHLPPLPAGETKSDWNDILIRKKRQAEKIVANSKTETYDPAVKIEKKNEEGELMLNNGFENQNLESLENLDPALIEKKNQKYVKDISDSLEKSLDKMAEKKGPVNNYLTKEEVQGLLDDHFTKIEQLLTTQTKKVEEMEAPTIQEAIEVADELSEGVKEQSISFKEQLKLAIVMKKNSAVYNIQNHVDNLRLTIKNGFNKRILRINQKIKNFSEKIDRIFAIEEKVVKVHPNEKYKNIAIKGPVKKDHLEYESLIANLISLSTEQKAYIRENLKLQNLTKELTSIEAAMEKENLDFSNKLNQSNHPKEIMKSSIGIKFKNLKTEHAELTKFINKFETLFTKEENEMCKNLLQHEPSSQTLGQFYKNYYDVSEVKVVVTMDRNECDRDTAIGLLADRYFNRNDLGVMHNLLADLPNFEKKVLETLDIELTENKGNKYVDTIQVISDKKNNPSIDVESPKNKFEERIAKAKQKDELHISEKSKSVNNSNKYEQKHQVVGKRI